MAPRRAAGWKLSVRNAWITQTTDLMQAISVESADALADFIYLTVFVCTSELALPVHHFSQHTLADLVVDIEVVTKGLALIALFSPLEICSLNNLK